MTFNTLDDSDIINKQNKILKPIFSSMILPGLGQYQKGEKLKALIFFGIEVSALYALNYYNKRGDKIVDDYQEFSNQNWSFENWILDYDCWNVAYQGINNDCNYEYSDVFSNISYDQNGNQFENYLSIWEHSHHIDFYFNNGLISTNDQIFQDLYHEFINWIEEDNDGKSFVEYYDIEVKKDHHFYEGIRKYNMFFAGWEDARDNIQRVVQPSGYIIATSPKAYRLDQELALNEYRERAGLKTVPTYENDSIIKELKNKAGL